MKVALTKDRTRNNRLRQKRKQRNFEHKNKQIFTNLKDHSSHNVYLRQVLYNGFEYPE